ncbi:MAG: methyl-accepting chemotaxis protein [Oscillospiraceae bacterium]|jgi:methyl-accepting chemotaxis protein|nr:methyl-accepting chemotaxis protein [Oscillospiraceae bacterium]
MKNLKIRYKILSGFIIVALLTVVVGMVGAIFVNTFSAETSNAVNTGVNAMKVNQLGIYIYDTRSVERASALYKCIRRDDEVTKIMESTLPELDEQSDALFLEIERGITVQTRPYFDKLIESRDALNAERKHFQEVMTGDYTYITYLIMVAMVGEAMDKLDPYYDDISLRINELTAFVGTDLSSKSKATATLAVELTAVIVVIMALAVAGAILLGLYISHLIAPAVSFMSVILDQSGRYGRVQFDEDEVEYLMQISARSDEVGICAKNLNSMLERIALMADKLGSVAQGNLTVQANSLSPDDRIGNAVIQMVENLNALFGNVSNAAHLVDSGANQIADTSISLARGTVEQSTAVEELSESVSGISKVIKKNSEMTLEASQLSKEMMKNAEIGTTQMVEMTKSVWEISEASRNISKVIKVIEDIAFQTNILALNASVEAARAGAAGKGFSVVAGEVRNLANKSAQAASETHRLIDTTVQKAEYGASITEDTAVSLEKIMSGITNSATIIEGIFESGSEQQSSIERILDNVDRITSIVQRNSAVAEETAVSSKELSTQSDILSGNVAKFELKSQTFGFEDDEDEDERDNSTPVVVFESPFEIDLDREPEQDDATDDDDEIILEL